ncbi:hypothetical protein [Yoonia sp. MH D7]
MPKGASDLKTFNLGVTYFVEVNGEFGGPYSDTRHKFLEIESDHLFAFVGPFMRGPLIHSQLINYMAIFALGGREAKILESDDVKVDMTDFHDITLFWEAHQLIETKRTTTSAGKHATFSELTPKGQKKLLSLRMSIVS